jgi:hypothetical protein
LTIDEVVPRLDHDSSGWSLPAMSGHRAEFAAPKPLLIATRR